MSTDTHEQLRAWVKSVSSAVPTFGPPSSERAGGPGVGLYLLEMRGELPLSPARPDHRQLELSYLVTASADEPADAEQLLVDLCFAAMDQPGMEVDLEPVSADVWQAFGVAPQPSFRVNVPLRRRRVEPEVRPVLRPLVIEPAALSSIAGSVLTPDGIGVAGARVELTQLGRTAATDRHGRFRLDGVPMDGRPLRLRVSARGYVIEHEVRPRDDRSAVAITLNPVEAVNG